MERGNGGTATVATAPPGGAGIGGAEEDGLLIDEELERERMRKIKKKLAKKRWVAHSDDSSESQSEEDDDKGSEEDDDGDKGDRPAKEGKGTEIKKNVSAAAASGAAAGAAAAGGDRPRTSEGEKSIEYLLKKYYSKEILDDLVKVGDKWVLKAELEKNEGERVRKEKETQGKQGQGEEERKPQGLKSLDTKALGASNKEREKGKKEPKKVTSPPLSPRQLLSFATASHKRRKADKGNSHPANSPTLGKRSPPIEPREVTTPVENRKRSATQVLKPGTLFDEQINPTEEDQAKENENKEKKDRKKKKERRRSLGPPPLSSSDNRGKEAVQTSTTSAEEAGPKRWSGDYGDHSNKKEEKGEVKRKLLSVKLHSMGSQEMLSRKRGMKSPTSANAPTQPGSPPNPPGAQPPQAPPPPAVHTVLQSNHGGRTLAREISEVYCYSDRRDPDFREEMLKREVGRRKLLEIKKDLERLEMETQRRKKESVKDENKKAKWGLLFSLPSDVRKLKEELVEDSDDGDDTEDPKGVHVEEMEARLRQLDLHLERTISQLLLVDPDEGEKLLAQKRAEEERRKKLRESQEEEEA